MSDREEEEQEQSSNASGADEPYEDEAVSESEGLEVDDESGGENSINLEDGVEDAETANVPEDTPYSFSAPNISKQELFETNTLPFHGREEDLNFFYESIDRMSLENQSEVLWVSGQDGVGKTTLVNEALDRSLVDTKHVIVCRVSCEEHHLASRPFDALARCLEDLYDKLQKNGGKRVWQPRFEEALGGDGPLLAGVTPKVRTLMDIAPFDSRRNLVYDINSRRRFERLAFAIRDFLRAVSNAHPLIMIVDNTHWADLDSMRIIQDLLTTKPLPNFLLIGCHDPVDEMHPLEKMKKVVHDAGTKVTQIELEPFELHTFGEILGSLLLNESAFTDDKAIDELRELAKSLYSFTEGNTLWLMTALRLFHDKNLLSFDQSTEIFDWQKLQIVKQMKVWKDGNDKILQSLGGTIEARVEEMRQKHRFPIEIIASLGLTAFRIDGNMTRLVKVAWLRKDKDCPISSDDDLAAALGVACEHGICKDLEKGLFKFSHDCIRQGVYSFAAAKVDNPEQKSPHMFMGRELSQISVGERAEQRFKFLTADQLNRCSDYLDKTGRAKLSKLNQEAAEICITRTAFRTAIEYLEAGIKLLDMKTAWKPEHYDISLRNFLYLARMHVCTSNLDTSKRVCRDVFKYTTSLKDKILTSHLMFYIMIEEEKYEEALTRTLSLLQRLGETFPSGENVPMIVEREVSNIRTALGQKGNKQLLTPPKNSDKKSLDSMFLLATLVEICEKCEENQYKELAIVRMMHLSLKFGYSRQYPLAFALFGTHLVKLGAIKEAHRVGQIAERMGRGTDIYGGKAVMLFHWHIGHWRRNYKRGLEPILNVYNAQIDSGDFHNADFSITTYSVYHLVSGSDLARLEDNLHLFEGVFDDYNLPKKWRISILKEVVLNLMTETENPLVFFGDTLDEQNTVMADLQQKGETEASEYFNFMRLFMAIFFHDYQLAQHSFANLEQVPEGVWIPWYYFFEALVLISQLPGTKGKTRKELKDRIEITKGRVIDYYNGGAPNTGAMVSLLEIEYLVSKEAGRTLATMKVQALFDEAIEAAMHEGAVHLHALICERAGMYFDITGVDDLSAVYLRRAHKMYERWGAFAKVIDVESRFADILNIVNPRRNAPTGALYTQEDDNVMSDSAKQPRSSAAMKKVQGLFGKKGKKEASQQYDDSDDNDKALNQSKSSLFGGKIKNSLQGKSRKKAGQKLAAQTYD